jgi:cardiolipin synthase
MRFGFFDLPWFVVVGVTLLDLYVLYRAITHGHGPEGTLAWVFAVLALPGIGAVAYLVLADPRVRRTTRRKRLSREALRRLVAERLHGGPRAEAAAGSILRMATGVTGLLPSRGNRVELLADDAGAFSRIADAVRRARRSIWAEYYIIRNDATGRQFLALLAERARAGIEVRLLFDAIGSMRLDEERLRAIRDAGGRAEPFLPLNPFRRRWAVHLRNHRKLVVVDGEAGFTGGMNVGDEYSGRARRSGLAHFRDTHLAIEGPAVADLGVIFAEDWFFATDERLEAPASPVPVPGGGAAVAVIPSGPDQQHNASGLLHFAGITSAEARCWLTTPYFVPDAETVRALQSAALRGVDVRLLLPARGDVPLVAPAGRSFYASLLRAGVRIWEYQPSMLHAKSMLVDDTVSMVGSANVDFRSFRLNFELGALVVDASFGQDMAARFLEDLRHSVPVTQAQVAARPFWVRLGQGAARLLSPVL